MKRLIVLCLTATVAACGGSSESNPGKSSYSDLPDQNGKPGANVCGVPGESGRIGFSYVDCERYPTISGTPFGQPLAVGVSVPVYIDSPQTRITMVESSNPSVATAKLESLGTDGTPYLSVKTLAPGTTKLMLRTAANPNGPIIDQVTIGVVEATDLRVTGMPKVEAFALRDTGFRGFVFCAQPTRDDAPVVGPDLVDVAVDDGLSVTPDAFGCRDDNALVSATGAQAYSLHAYGAEPRELKLSIPGVEKTFHVTPVEEKDLTDVTFEPAALTVDSETWALASFDVTVLAGTLPVVGVNCTMALKDQKDADVVRFVGTPSPEVSRYVISMHALQPGQYELTCSLDDGRVQQSLPITVQ